MRHHSSIIIDNITSFLIEIVILIAPQSAMVLSGQPVCFQCEYTGTSSYPRWRINEDEYPSANLPIEYEYSSESGLCIDEVDLSMNGSQFSCSFVTYFEVIESNIGHLTVIESTSEWCCFFFLFSFNTNVHYRCICGLVETRKQNYCIGRRVCLF